MIALPRNKLSRRPGESRPGYDPAEYLILRYTLQAVLDYFFPTTKCTDRDLATARQFIFSDDGRALISYFGIPIPVIRRSLHANTGDYRD